MVSLHAGTGGLDNTGRSITENTADNHVSFCMRLDIAVHLAACAWLRGMSQSFIATLPAGFHVARDSLPIIRDVDVLHRNPLFPAHPVFSQGLELGRECSGELVEPGIVGFFLFRGLAGMQRAPASAPSCDAIALA